MSEKNAVVATGRVLTDAELVLLHSYIVLQVQELQKRRNEELKAKMKVSPEILRRKIKKLLPGVVAFRAYFAALGIEAVEFTKPEEQTEAAAS